MTFYHDQGRGLLIYDQPPGLIEQCIPEAQRLNGRYVALPHNLRNAQVLRHLNYPVPAIITDQNYHWPIEPGKTALEHQKVMANFDVLHRRAFNLSDPGTMKTQSKIWAADWLMRQYPPGECRCLIIAPLTILETVWALALFRTFLGTRTVEILHGDAGKRKALLAKKPDFAIINFDGVGVGAHTRKQFNLDGFSLDLANDDKIKIVIVDEADAYCDAQTKRHRIARAVFGNRPYLLPQTGTPTGNAPTDAYGIAKLVNNAFGKSFKTFQKETMIQVTPFKWVAQKDGYEKARRLLFPAIRYSIEDVWKDAPEMTTQQRKVALTSEQDKALASLKRDLVVAVRNGVITANNEGAARQKFLQIVAGAVYDEKHGVHLINAEPRYVEIEKLIHQSPHKVLIFVGLTSIVDLLSKRLSKTWKCGVINGDVSQKERLRLISEMETDPDLRVMIMDPQPTAHGINQFVVADTVIWATPTDKTRLYIQGNKRAHRPGQKYPVTVHQVVATKLEQEIFSRLETNTSLQGMLLEMVRKGEL